MSPAHMAALSARIDEQEAQLTALRIERDTISATLDVLSRT